MPAGAVLWVRAWGPAHGGDASSGFGENGSEMCLSKSSLLSPFPWSLYSCP